MDPDTPTRERPNEDQPEQFVATHKEIHSIETTVPITGKRQAFRDIRRQLQEAELSSPGVQKLLLEDLERAESECDVLEGYVQRYHEADKRAAIFEERLRTQTAMEILFAVGISLGGVLIGLAPSLWNSAKGPVVLSIGFVLVIGSAVARIVKR